MVKLADFQRQLIPVHSDVCPDVQIECRTAGAGPGLLLLHGYPQNSHLWRFVAPELAEHFTVVAADLRGYGGSSKPHGSESHVEYSKREMANDMVQVMKHFGFDQFHVIAHDRGARVAHRMGLDHPASVSKMVLMDIAPTLYMYENTNMQFAMAYWHWFFLPQPNPGPEDVIMADPDRFWAMLGGRSSHMGFTWSPEDTAAYKTPYFTPEGVHAACEDYRAAATIDLEHDRKSMADGNKLALDSLLVLWGTRGLIDKYQDPGAVEIWRGRCQDSVQVSGFPTQSGHFIPEEAPEEVMKRLHTFFDLA